jgi:hypothetical protein
VERLRVLLAAVRDTREVKRTVIRTMVLVDEALDAVLYRPAVVKAFTWAPRWCLCDLAKFSMALDDRWRVGYSDQAGVVSGRSCEACGRRASIHLVGGRSGDCGPEQVADTGDGGVLEDRAVHLCGWCHIEGPILTEKDLERELIAAARDAVAWRWRSEPGRG